MKAKNISKILALMTAVMAFASCSDSWLEIRPLSFYSPENAYVDADGMYGALTACERNMRHEYFGDAAPIVTEYVFSDMCVEGTTDKSGPAQNLNLLITPTANLNSGDYNKIGWYWYEGYKGVKYANVVISRIDDATYTDTDERDAVLSSAYFHRAYRYYRLANQFGDVPYIGEEVTAPKLDYYSTKREVILQSIKKDMDFAAQKAIVNNDKGRVTRGACGHLLTKINLSLGLFDDAIASATAVIDGGQHSLMTARFGVDASQSDKNVVWDLHRPDNKSVPANRECLMNVISRVSTEGSDRMQVMRNCVPFWSTSGANAIKTPNGKTGMSQANNIEYEYVQTMGRGIGRCRAVPYATRMIWKLDDTDLRHQKPWYDGEGAYHQGNWMDMEDLVYNNPNLNNSTSSDYAPEWYGKPLQLYADGGNTILTLDTIRIWFSWPFYKLWVPDPTQTQWAGGETDWYIFRLAETYLLRAEAYFWKGELQKAADDINMVRRRAQAREISTSEVTMRMILDERARELYYEEPRKTELTRISFIYAQTGKAADDGTVYNLSSFSEKNFYFDHIMATTHFYNKGVKTVHADEYTMSAYHVLWPVPQESITSNTQGKINQNKGYSGYENNVEPLDAIQ
ncbi:MAG: RagB/SusD family nutrient uptake outer membrane protein [Bacteroidales bacterium]|jgi:hypothetical protein|nr:RagB/SusD family nutrient uptake outer membrane protein [Bacteroidales bacterium]